MDDTRKIMVVSSIPTPTPPQVDGEGNLVPQWADLTKLTWTVMKRYCDKHGYGFRPDVSDIALPLVSPYVDQRAMAQMSRIRYMVKFRLMHHFLREELCRQQWDWVVWLDADMVITDMETPLTKFTNTKGRETPEEPEDLGELGDLIVPFDINTIHPTVIMARSTRLSRNLFWALTEAGDRLWRQHEWCDHFALKTFMHERPYREMLWQHSAKVLCAQHPGLYPPYTDLYSFEEGVSWAVHLSALPTAKRIELAKQYIEKYGLLS